MTKRYDYNGGFISAGVSGQRGGIFSLARQYQLEQSNSWDYDTNFANVSLLINSDQSTTTVPFTQDNSGNNFSLSVFGDVRPNNISLYNRNFYSNYFNGSSDFLTVPASSLFNITTGTTPFTVEAWIRPMGNTGCVFSEAFTGGSNPINIVVSMADGISMDTGTVGQTICFGWYTGSAWITAAGAGMALTLGQWTHLACVFTGSTTRIYYNGVDVTKPSNPVPATTWGITNNNGDSYFIGRRWDTTGSPFFNGFIKDLRFVRGTAVYTTNFTPPTAPLTAIANTSVLTCQTNSFVDNSSNALTITRNGSPQVSQIIPFTNISSSFPGATFFDGTGDYLSFPATAATSFGTGDYTIEFWIYLVGTGDFTVFDNQGSGGNSQISRISGILYHGSATVWSYTFTNNVWTHVAFSRQGTNLRLFANGVLQQTQINSNVVGSATNTNTVGIRNDNFYPLNGYLSNLRIVKGTAVYTTAFTPPTEPLTAIAGTSLLTFQNTGHVNNSGFIDRSLNNLIVTRNGNITQGSFNPYASGWSNFFNGTSGFLTTTTSAAFTMGTGDFTVEAWVYLATPATNGGVTTDRWVFGGFNFTPSFVCFINNSTIYRASIWNGTNQFNSSITIEPSQWTHVAWVRQAGVLNIYTNGVSGYTNASYTINWTASTTPHIGRADSSADRFFPGYISNLRVVKGTAAYTANFTPPIGQLSAIANTSLLTCQSNRFVDNSGNNLAISINGTASVQKFSPFANTNRSYNSSALSGSFYSDGSGDYLSVAATPATAFLTSNFTIEFWVYFNNSTVTATHQGLYTNYSTYAAGSIYFGKHPTNGGCVAVYVNNFGGLLLAELTLPPNNSWIHYALVRNGTSVALYRNGLVSASNTVSATLSFTGASNPVFIGYIGDVAASSLPGYMADFRISNYAVYTGAFTPPTAPLSPDSGTVLMIGNQAAIVDHTMSSNFETNGDARISTAIRQFGSSSLSFDGNNDWLFAPGNTIFNFGGGNWTVEAWVYLNAMPTSDAWPTNFSLHMVLTCVGTPSAADGFNCIIGQTRLMIQNNDVRFEGTAHGMVINTWYHVAYVRNGNTVFFYVNGQARGSVAFTGSVGVGANTWIGCETGQGAYFNGFIDDLRVTRGVARYTAAFVPPARLAIR